MHKGSAIRLKRDMYGLLKLHEMCMWPDCSSRRMGDEMYVCRFHATLIESALDDLRIAEDDEYAARLQRWRDSLDRNNEAMNAGEFGDDALLMVVADHGFTSFRRGVNLNNLLYDLGYLKTKDDKPKAPTRNIGFVAKEAIAQGATNEEALKAGQQVTFDLVDGPKGPHAANIMLAESELENLQDDQPANDAAHDTSHPESSHAGAASNNSEQLAANQSFS